MSSAEGFGAATAVPKRKPPAMKTSQRRGICMGGDDAPIGGGLQQESWRFQRLVQAGRKPLAARDFPLDHPTSAAMIPRLIPPETAKIHYVRKLGKHNLDNLLLRGPDRPIP